MDTKTQERRPNRIAKPAARQAADSQSPIAGMQACIDDVRAAALDGDKGPDDPIDFSELRRKLETARGKFPPLYLQDIVVPFIAALNALGPQHFTQILVNDPSHQRTAGLMLDIARSILERSDRYEWDATNAFQQLVDDLYDGFLSAEDRRGINPPDREVDPPLVKWGNPDFGPYTWPADATSSFGAKVAVVNLPPANARKGLLAWTALPHECGGHDILHADTGLLDQLAQAVRTAVTQAVDDANLADYWASRIDETASDVAGILNMGPAPAIGLIGYFRGLMDATNPDPRLRVDGPADDQHPADIVRAFVAAETVALLPFSDAGTWQKLIVNEAMRDLGDRTITLAEQSIGVDLARKAAAAVAKAIVSSPMDALEKHALGDIQTWRDSDEAKVSVARQALTTAGDLNQGDGQNRIFAAHIVAAAALEVLSAGQDIPTTFGRMKSILAKMHTQNPVWGPLFVRHPGNIVRDFVYRIRKT